MAVARYFEASRWDGTIPMVGLADIDEVEWAGLPKYIKAQVDSLPYFRKTKPEGDVQIVVIPDPVYDDFSAPVVAETPVVVEAAPEIESQSQARRTTMKLTTKET